MSSGWNFSLYGFQSRGMELPNSQNLVSALKYIFLKKWLLPLNLDTNFGGILPSISPTYDPPVELPSLWEPCKQTEFELRAQIAQKFRITERVSKWPKINDVFYERPQKEKKLDE